MRCSLRRARAALERWAEAMNEGPYMFVHGPDGSLLPIPRPDVLERQAMGTYPPAKTRGKTATRASAGQLHDRIEAGLELVAEIEDAGDMRPDDACLLRATLRGLRPERERAS